MSVGNTQAADGRNAPRRFESTQQMESVIFALPDNFRRQCIRASHKTTTNTSQVREALDKVDPPEPCGTITTITLRGKNIAYILQRESDELPEDDGLFLLQPMKGSGPKNTMKYAVWTHGDFFTPNAHVWAMKSNAAGPGPEKESKLETVPAAKRKRTKEDDSPAASKVPQTRTRGAPSENGSSHEAETSENDQQQLLSPPAKRTRTSKKKSPAKNTAKKAPRKDSEELPSEPATPATPPAETTGEVVDHINMTTAGTRGFTPVNPPPQTKRRSRRTPAAIAIPSALENAEVDDQDSISAFTPDAPTPATPSPQATRKSRRTQGKAPETVGMRGSGRNISKKRKEIKQYQAPPENAFRRYWTKGPNGEGDQVYELVGMKVHPVKFKFATCVPGVSRYETAGGAYYKYVGNGNVEKGGDSTVVEDSDGEGENPIKAWGAAVG